MQYLEMLFLIPAVIVMMLILLAPPIMCLILGCILIWRSPGLQRLLAVVAMTVYLGHMVLMFTPQPGNLAPIALFAYSCIWIPVFLGLFWWFRRLRMAERLQRGLCVQCAYDLRGTEQDDKCPECGSVREYKAGQTG